MLPIIIGSNERFPSLLNRKRRQIHSCATLLSALAGLLAGALIAILFGSLLVDEAGFEFGDSWLTLAYVFWVVALGLDHGVLIPFNRRLRRRAQGLVDEKVEESAELMAEAGLMRTMLVALALDGSLVIFVYLMVAKPGLS